MHVIDVSAIGCVQAMHNDKFDLGFLGQQDIQRASDIRFDAKTQSWGVWLFDGRVFVRPQACWAGFAGYEEARRFEVEMLNLCRVEQIKPLSGAAEKLAKAKRQA